MTRVRKLTPTLIKQWTHSGPRTATGKATAGKSTSRYNARRHGLTGPIFADPEVGPRIEPLAQEIAGSSASAPLLELARQVAVAHLDLVRCRVAQSHVIAPAFTNAGYWSQTSKRMPTKAELQVMHGPPTPEKLMLVISDAGAQLTLMARYEQRALRRRNRAIQNFNTLRIMEATST